MKSSLITILIAAVLIGCSAEESPSERKNENTALELKATKTGQYRKDKSLNYKSESAPVYAANVPINANVTTEQTSLAPATQLTENRQIIWNADLEFRVKSLDKSFQAIRSMCEKHNGFIADMEQQNGDSKSSMRIHIRVKSNQFHNLVAAIKGESENLDVAVIRSEDVTEEFVDIQNRLATKRNARERYIEILRSKTGTIEEVIEAEEAIRRITEEIEAKEGRLRYLSDRVDLSTVEILMYTVKKEDKPIVAEAPTFGDHAKSSFASGWSAIKSIGLALIRIWPLLLLLFGIFIWKRQWIRSKFARN